MFHRKTPSRCPGVVADRKGVAGGTPQPGILTVPRRNAAGRASEDEMPENVAMLSLPPCPEAQSTSPSPFAGGLASSLTSDNMDEGVRSEVFGQEISIDHPVRPCLGLDSIGRNHRVHSTDGRVLTFLGHQYCCTDFFGGVNATYVVKVPAA